jgi:hypothetical protein
MIEPDDSALAFFLGSSRKEIVNEVHNDRLSCVRGSRMRSIV